ncbi:MAG: hypothetical protein RLZZ299_2077, partial [Pseudomonadota bacterium]
MKLATLAILLACGNSTGTSPGAEGVTPPCCTTPRPASPAAAAASPVPGPAAPRVPTGSPTRMAARHILVAFRTTSQARPGVTRTREEARARAEEALRQVRAGE